MGGKIPPIEPYDGLNWDTWAPQIIRTAKAHKEYLYQYIKDPPTPKPGNGPDEADALRKWEQGDAMIHEIIELTMVPEKRLLIRHCASAREVWTTLETVAQQQGTLSAAHLGEELMSVSLSDHPGMADYLAAVTNLRAKLKNCNLDLSNQWIILILLKGLTPEYQLVKQLLYDKDLTTLTLEIVSTRLLEAEANKKTEGREGVFATKAQFKPKNTKGGKVNKGGKKPLPSTYSKGGPCAHCKYDHPSDKCYKWRTEQWIKQHGDSAPVPDWRLLDKKQGGGQKKKKKVNFAAGPKYAESDSGSDEADERVNVMFASSTANANVTAYSRCTSSSWLVDSGATTHMCNSKALFTDYQPLEPPEPVQGAFTDSNCLALGRGTVHVQTHDNAGTHVLELKQCLHIPDLTVNLISVPQLDKAGYTALCKDGKCQLLCNEERVAKATLHGSLYQLHAAKATAFAGAASTSWEHWHRRLGHLHQGGMEQLAKEQRINGLPSSLPAPTCLCEACQVSKCKRKPFQASTSRAEKPLELVHMDLVGPVRPPSKDQCSYALVIVDDWSRRNWVFLLKHKSEATPTIQRWTTQVCNEKDIPLHLLKILRTDRGGEFLNHTLQRWCAEKGIRHELSVPETPQQNGVVERRNQTLFHMVRSLLTWAQANQQWWGEALLYAAHTVNHWPLKANRGMTPLEKWCGRKPDIDQLHTFGCRAYVRYQDSEVKSKLQPRGRSCMFLGAADVSKGFRLYDPSSKKIIISRDVTFEDDIPYNSPTPTPAPQGPALTEEIKVPDTNALTPPSHADSEDSESDQSDSPSESSSDGGDDEPPEAIEVPGTPEGSPQLPPLRGTPEDRSPELPRRRRAGQGAHGWRNLPPREPSRRARGLQPEPLPRTFFVSDWREDVVLTVNKLEEPRIPTSHKEAMESPEAEKWIEAESAEMASITKNETYELVPRMPDMHVLGNKWVYRIKSGGVYKARVVVKGYLQKEGVDFQEIFAPTAKHITLRVVLHLAAVHDWELEQIDFVTAFLNGDLEEEIFMEQVPGHEDPKYPDRVCKLKKALYGLKQAPRQWFAKLKAALTSMGFVQHAADSCLFMRMTGVQVFLVVVYVDDLILAASSKTELKDFKQTMADKFAMKDLGELETYLGLKIIRDREKRTIALSQSKYIENMLERFELMEAHPCPTPLELGHDLTSPVHTSAPKSSVPYPQLVGTLMYIMVCTRPDICYALSVLTRYMAIGSYTETHWKAAQRVAKYLKGTKDHVLLLGGTGTQLTGFCDASWGDDLSTRHSTLGYCFNLGTGAISWRSKKSGSVAVSTTEAEYYAQAEAVKEGCWLRMLLSGLKMEQGQTPIHCDNTGAVKLAHNPVSHSRTKHIDITHHFLREKVANKEVDLVQVPTKDNTADILTKPLTKAEHIRLSTALGMREANTGLPHSVRTHNQGGC
jgi:hypothetical protein